LIVLVVGVGVISIYENKNQRQVVEELKFKISQLIDMETDEIKNKIDERMKQIKELSVNPTLSLYLSTYQKSISDDVALSAMRGYVNNLLQASLLRYGLLKSSSKSKQIDMRPGTDYGLAIVDKNNQFIMSTKRFPKNINQYKKSIEQAYVTGEAQIIEFYQDRDNQSVYGYVAPILKIQSLEAKQFSGAVIMLLDVRKDLFSEIAPLQRLTHIDSSFLLRHEKSVLVYINSMSSEVKTEPWNSRQSLLSRYFFKSDIDDVDTFKTDKGESIMLARKQIQNNLWLIKKAPVDHMLLQVINNQFFISIIFLLLVLLAGLMVYIARYRACNLKQQSLYAGLKKTNELLERVSDNTKDKIIILNDEDKVVFMNNEFSQALSIKPAKFQNIYVRQVLGEALADAVTRCRQSGEEVSLPFNGKCKLHTIKLTELLLADDSQMKMVVLHDVSPFKREQNQYERRNKRIINAIINAIDGHDPYCEKHSERTCEVALAIADAMGLSQSQQVSLEVAATLANIGKLQVPKQILTKKQHLTTAETNRLQQHVEFAVDMLAKVEFEGPVLDIIAQKNEHLDGSGYPKGLTQREIMTESRILAVANAFVAMVSARAYRKGRGVNDVLAVLLAQAGLQYDRQVVAALFHICENKKDWNIWQVV